MRKVGTHKLRADMDMSEFIYYTCTECGMIMFFNTETGFIISSANGSVPLEDDPAKISCADWVVREIIK